jgi:hypothetical protein
MSRIHLKHSTEPLTPRVTHVALCGEVIPEAQFAPLWDETAMGAGIGESLNRLRVCGKCVKAAGKLERYVYAIQRPELQKEKQ